jgi:hypothetical protein
MIAGGLAGCVAKTIMAPLSRLTILFQVKCIWYLCLCVIFMYMCVYMYMYIYAYAITKFCMNIYIYVMASLSRIK